MSTKLELQDKIRQLQAKLRQLQAELVTQNELHQLVVKNMNNDATIDQAALSRFEEFVHNAKDVVRPFAYQSKCLESPKTTDGDAADDVPIANVEHFRFRGSYAAITAGDCRRAAKFLESLGEVVE